MIGRRAMGLFRERFGGEPAVMARAPGRVNLIGEHVDYAGGVVLPIAIERSTVVAARRTQRSESTIASEARGEVTRSLIDQRTPLADQSSWVNYILGPFRELASLEVELGEFEIAVVSDIPIGSGVSSSAALEVAAAMAFIALSDRPPEPALDHLALAKLCQRGEHRYAGTPCGLMDMTVSIAARPRHALRLDCTTLGMRHIPVPPEASVLVVDSGVRHRLSDGGYATRRASVDEAARRLGVRLLGEAPTSMVEAAHFESDLLRRARHVTSEVDRARRGADALEAGDLAAFGRAMNESHASLRDDFEVSVEELDAIVSLAQGSDGVFGARMTGGGFGGCAIALVDTSAARRVEGEVRTAFALRFGAQPASFVTSAAGGATLVPVR